MQYIIETDSYNERRYGKPWLARVGKSLTKDFEFILWNGRPGLAGDFRFSAQPGEILAKGQKDNRKGRGGVDMYLILLPDGDNIKTSLLDIPDSRLLALDLAARWQTAVRQRLDYWLQNTRSDSATRWRLVDKYSRLLGVPNPLMTQAAIDLGLVSIAPPPQSEIAMDAFF